MKTASEFHDEWARGRGVDSPEESQAKQQAWLEAKAKEGGAITGDKTSFREFAREIGAEIRQISDNVVELVPEQVPQPKAGAAKKK